MTLPLPMSLHPHPPPSHPPPCHPPPLSGLLDSQNKSLYVKNLPSYLSEDQLRIQLAQVFGKFGTLISIMIKVDPTHKKPYAFINFEH